MERLVLIDGHSLLYRAYHALPKTFHDREGNPTNAVYGFMTMLRKASSDLSPSYLAVAFDERGPTLRHTKLATYKEGRPEPEEDFIAQNPIIREVLAGFNIPVFSIPGYEGEDIIATIVAKIRSSKSGIRDLETYIVSGDRDVLQLIDEQTKVYTPGKSFSQTVIYSLDNVENVFGVKPSQIPEFKGLRGDPGDRIPGVFGIGEKTAASLINKFGTVENLYRNLGKVRGEFGESVEKKLSEGAEAAVLSRDLAHIHNDAPLEFKVSELEFNGFNDVKGLNVLKNLGFKSLLKRFGHEEFLEKPKTAGRNRVKKKTENSEGQVALL